MSDVLVIGLTGNIATGKSTVCAMLAGCGALTIDADEIVHRLLDEDAEVQAEVVAQFGPHIRTREGKIDRGRLGAKVFANNGALDSLERILHPRVGAQVDGLIAHSSAPVVIVEAIKLLESELRPRCDAIWVTDCAEEGQVSRLMKDRRMKRGEALARIRSQPPQADKLAQADVVIDTSGTLEDTHSQVRQAWQRLTGRRCA